MTCLTANRALMIVCTASTWKALRSPLSQIPGPWYAPFTTMHLRYGFATGNIWKVAENAHRKYGSVVRLGPRQVWIADKTAMQQILSTIDLPKVTMYAEISRDRFAPGLFGEIRPEPHRRLKRFLSPAFTVSYVDKLESYFAKSIGDLIAKYEAVLGGKGDGDPRGATVDLMDDLHNVALDIMGESSFGRGFGQTNPQKGAEEGADEKAWKMIPHAIFDGMTKRYQNVYVKRFLRSLGVDLKFDWPAEMVKAIDVVVERRASRPEAGRADVLQHFIEEGARPDTGVRMNTRDIVDQMSELLLAGSETTSGTIACLFLELVQNPAVKQKLLRSLPVLGPDDPVVDGRTVRLDRQYEYPNACIKENLRLHPIASEMGRRTGKQWVNLVGYSLPPGTVVSASYRDLHRNPQFWPEPERFWPERWLDDDRREGAPAPDMAAYYPFSAGKHSCIGINFAWAEVRMVAANLFARYDFDEMANQAIDYRQYITMQFKDGSWKPLSFHASGRTAPNRFLKGAMSERLASWDPQPVDRGVPSPELAELYEVWGRGQIGVLVTGNVMVDAAHPEAVGNAAVPSGAEASPRRLEAFRAVARAGKRHGSLVIAQISHPGRQCDVRVQPDPVVSASDVQLQGTVMGMRFGKPHAAQREELSRIVQQFQHAAAYLEIVVEA
ncbi:putative cytochrome p450 3a9 protein [Neofusicoccum parvum UCRNP2]|uniref:Putative cytochrome p450 3a9 protein n=1 Tax=Botryosphaeria parva (strain UCR-NP2) TaxID=1287680 RepID=R1GCW1_BOTPV|nr:putative cytochrome p450 3a9 protein [Neofusicoccum parvum UCRNP2]